MNQLPCEENMICDVIGIQHDCSTVIVSDTLNDQMGENINRKNQ